jgi:hypothetical protein
VPVARHSMLALAVTLALGACWTPAALAVAPSAPASPALPDVRAAEDSLNNGEDITKPVNRFDVRFQGKTLPNATESGQVFDDRHQETLTLRSDLRFFQKPDQLALRIDLPLVWNNAPNPENKQGVNEFGLGDLLLQAAYVRTLNSRWAAAVGLQTILPTATGQAFGDGKWQLLPSAALRAELPEISAGSYAGLIVRESFSVAGSSARKSIDQLILEPQFNLGLSKGWFLNSSPKIYCNLETSQWFVPLDLMIGKRFGSRWIGSVEYQYGWVRDYDRYNQWVELRIGYFF